MQSPSISEEDSPGSTPSLEPTSPTLSTEISTSSSTRDEPSSRLFNGTAPGSASSQSASRRDDSTISSDTPALASPSPSPRNSSRTFLPVTPPSFLDRRRESGYQSDVRVEQILQHLAALQAERDALAIRLEETEAHALELTEQLAQQTAKVGLLEDESEVLLARLRELTRQLALATRTDEQLALQFLLNQVQKELNAKNAEQFATKSERRSTKNDKKTEEEKEKKPGHGPTPQPALPVDPQLHLLDEADRICPHCGKPLNEWHGQTEDSDEITVVKRVYRITHHKRQKYKCSGTDCDHIETALGPMKLFPGARYSVDFAIQIAIDKYLDGLPLNRQVRRMLQNGLKVTRTTLWDQLLALYRLLLPTLVALHAQILTAPMVHADETTWPVLGRGKTKKWWVWSTRSVYGVYFQIVPSRGAAAGRELLQDYAGLVLADGYGVYGSLEKLLSRVGGVQQVLLDGEVVDVPTPNFTLASCWAHIRRYFIQAEKSGDERAGAALDLIGELYGIEAELVKQASSTAELLSLRASVRPVRSAGVLEKLDAWCEKQRLLAGTLLAKAVGYYQSLRSRARVFLSEPVVPLDNNPIEQSLRGVVVGRKAFQGSRSEAGTRVAALFYSLLTTCRLLSIDPAAYLREAVQRILSERNKVFLPSDYQALIDAGEIGGKKTGAHDSS